MAHTTQSTVVPFASAQTRSSRFDIARSASQPRRNEYDVTDTIKVTSTEAVKQEVIRIYKSDYPNAPIETIAQAFDTFDDLFSGKLRGYMACDTLYHDIQHSLDMTLAMVRLMSGYESVHGGPSRLGAKRAKLGILTALFHDAGYIRKERDTRHTNGAEYTKVHVSRSAQFLEEYLPQIGETDLASIARHIVHFTGYEIEPNKIPTEDSKDRIVGCMVGTADLVAQMADRCYLEKCRDRLFPEFVLGGIATVDLHDGGSKVIYASALDLLYKTPAFYRVEVRKRLEFFFGSLYHFAGAHFDGMNYYMLELENNIRYLEQLIADNNLDELRRRPPKNAGMTVFPYDRLKSILLG